MPASYPGPALAPVRVSDIRSSHRVGLGRRRGTTRTIDPDQRHRIGGTLGKPVRKFNEPIAAMRGAGDERWGAMSPLGRWIAVVADDAAVCDSMRFLLETYDFEVSTYLDGTDYFEDNPKVACPIVDYQCRASTVLNSSPS